MPSRVQQRVRDLNIAICAVRAAVPAHLAKQIHRVLLQQKNQLTLICRSGAVANKARLYESQILAQLQAADMDVQSIRWQSDPALGQIDAYQAATEPAVLSDASRALIQSAADNTNNAQLRIAFQRLAASR